MARCPMCRMTFPVPADAAITPGNGGEEVLHIGPDDSGIAPMGSTPASTNPSAPAAGKGPADSWFLRVPEGHQYGPVPKSEMDAWVKEGRVTAQCQLRNGDGPWQPAGAVYSFLGSPPAQGGFPSQPMQPANPFAQPMGGGPYNPYAAPMAPQMPFGGYGYTKPHRGGLVLGLALAGQFCCPIFSLISLAMSFNDLGEMDRGIMDRSGQGLTRGAQILSIITCVLFGLGLLMMFVGAAIDA